MEGYHYKTHNPGNMGPENVAKAVALNEDGRSMRYISNVLGVARNTVNYAIRRYNETGEYGRRQGSGQPRCTNERDDRYAWFISTEPEGEVSKANKGSFGDVEGNANKLNIETRGTGTNPWVCKEHNMLLLSLPDEAASIEY
ncbi:hypothetical protein C0J52_13687 [Blattella germanica]|nr:hypothetical protein C0J52_13687 [Blattella germanica]